MENIAMESVTALGIIALIIVLGDRWIARMFKRLCDHMERVELAHNQQSITDLKMLDVLLDIQESFQNLDNN